MINTKKSMFLLFVFFVNIYLFAEEFKIMSFNIQYGNTKRSLNTEEWMNNFLHIVLEVNPDILLVQEIGAANNGINHFQNKMEKYSYKMFSTEKYFASKTYINSGVTYSGYGGSTQHNAIFYKTNKFTEAKDLYQRLIFDNPSLTRFPTDFNNLQCIKLKTMEGKNLIIINAHVRPEGNDYYKMKEGTIHSRDTITLRELMYEMNRIYSTAGIIVGGDFNYSWRVLTGVWSDGRKLSSEWTVDPGYYPKTEKEQGLSTTLSEGPWDHIIVNDRISMTKNFSIPLILSSDEKNTYTHINGEKMDDRIFKREISDHWPVSINFEF